MRRYLTSRKVLAASIGVATITYVACSSTDSGTPTTSGDAGTDGPQQIVGNLMGTPQDSSLNLFEGNLMPPPFDAAPNDATLDADDGAADDGGALDAPSDSPSDG